MAPAKQEDDITAVVPEIVDDTISPKDAKVAPKAGEMVSPKVMEEGGKAKPAKYFPLWKLSLVALPQLAVQVTWCFIGPTAEPYMEHLGAGPSLAILNNVAGPIAGFFTGPIVGAWSDRLTSRWGRRRPIILAGLIATWVAGVLFAAADHMFGDSTGKIVFAFPMKCVLDVTINILQTPYRALVSDLATKEQQLPLQVIFVFFMAIGNMIGYGIMKIWAVPAAHMLELMLMICAMNTVCVGIQFMVAQEEPLKRAEGEGKGNCCSPVFSVCGSLRGMPRLLYHLAFVQCLVWIGNTVWTYYANLWFGVAVYQGYQHADKGSELLKRYEQGMDDFSTGGVLRSGIQLISALAIIWLLMKTSLRPRLIYAPCILVGAAVSFLGGFAVGHTAPFALVCFVLSILPETGSFAIPFGLVATLNKRAEEEGKQVSTALQMALLNCCVTVGQQVCHIAFAVIVKVIGDIEDIKDHHALEKGLPCLLVFAAVAYTLGGSSALCLDDKN